jgi:protein dithiol oxidoreductase (disulfide-forming)
VKRFVAALGSAIGMIAGCLMLAPVAVAAEPIQDVDYVLIVPQPTPPGKIEVIEFFFYGCESCYRLEPRLQSWLKSLPADVEFRRIPAIRRTAWTQLTRLYFALEELGEVDRLHMRVYRAIHEGGLNLGESSDRSEWARKAGIDADNLERTLESDNVQIQLQRAHDSTVAYGVRATPSFVVDGKYLTSGGTVGTLDAVLPVVDGLIDKVRSTKPAK